MATIQRKLRVFLCHASEDKLVVRAFHKRLVSEGWIDPWLDTSKLVPGQDWRVSIEAAIELADVVIFFLSSNSVNKEGFVRKELRYAREIALEKPEGVVFIMPLRVDDCPIPSGFRAWQYADYFGEQREENYQRIIRSLSIRLEQIIVGEKKEEQILEQRESEERADLEQRSRREITPLVDKEAVEREKIIAAELARKEAEERKNPERKYGIFVSYSRVDLEFVRMLTKDLESSGEDVWWDISRLQGGETWTQTIQKALDNSKYCIVVITPDSVQSRWVAAEYTYALNKNLTVIPLYLKTVENFPFAFSIIQYIDFRDNRYEMAIHQLTAALKLRLS